MKLTVSAVTGAEPGAETYTLWDSELAGFGLVVRPSGHKSFIVKYRIGGGRGAKQKKVSLGRVGSPYTASQARQKAKDMLAEARGGADPSQALRTSLADAMTVADMLDEWEKESAPFDRRNGRRRKPASVAGDIRRLNIHVRTLIGSTRLRDVTPDTLRKLRADIAEGKTARREKSKVRGVSRATGGDGTAVATLRILKSALAYATDKGWIAENPASKVKLPPTGSRERFLSGAELEALGSALDRAEAEGLHPHALNIIRLLALTGARRGEIERLTWAQVDFDRGAVVLEDTKTGRAAWPLSRPALQLLEALPREAGSPFVFPATRGDGYYLGLNQVWPKVRAMAELEGVRLHDLRHSFASVGASGGVGLPVVGKLLGHKQASTTQRYSHIADDPLRAAADQVGGQIAARMKLKPLKAVEGGK